MQHTILKGSTPSRTRLERLLAPKSVVFIGGRIAEMAIARCREAGFSGEIFAVHPSREFIGDVRCYRSIADLPSVPDAAYVGVNREATIDVVRALAERDAGGCVCYAAGFAEVGGEGIALQARLVDAAGEMPLIGPNCFGFINYLDGCALWPYLFGGQRIPQGVALISQSGNVAMNLTMNERSVRFTHVICAGNQAVQGPGDYLAALLADSRVRAVGMVLEGLDDLDGFAHMAQRALSLRIPIVVLKIGRTAAGAERASSHTSSLTGSDVLYDAFFERLGVIRVDSLHQLLETLKVFDIAGPLPGRNIVTLSCSGGEAGMLADLCGEHDLKTPAFTQEQTAALHKRFPGYVTVSNPFDYNTSIWGDRQAMQQCFATSMRGTHDAALLIYDHPTIEAQEVDEWLDCLEAFVDAHVDTGMRAFVVCTVSELLPAPLRERLISAGITPLQGLDTALYALSAAAGYHERQAALVNKPLPRSSKSVFSASTADGTALDEWQGKQQLQSFGVPIPDGRLVGIAELDQAAETLGFPLVLKACGAGFQHKSELGAVCVGLTNLMDLRAAAQAIQASVATHGLKVESFLLERMVDDGVAELIIGIHRDAQFGPTLVIGSGGVLVELVGDAVSLLLPTDRASVTQALSQLKVSKLLAGFRGRPPGDTAAVIDVIMAIAQMTDVLWDSVQELDVNPLIVRPQGQGAVAVDALLRLSTYH
jgi:acyl-CoA synthetase (NDP forming)